MLHPEGLSMDELKAFREVCVARGRNPDDFTLDVLDGSLPANAGTARVVTVKRDSIIRCYQGGFGSSWLAQFVEDMRAGRWL
jgi:hypothetical protein